VHCDAEVEQTGAFKGVSNSDRFPSIDFSSEGPRSLDYSHSGKYSVRLTKATPYGFTYKIINAKEGELFRISAWRHISSTEGCLVAAAEDYKKFYLVQHRFIKQVGDWVLLMTEFTVPKRADSCNIKIYCFAEESDKPVYFDDLKIEYIDSIPPKIINEMSIFTDTRDEKIYKTVKIGAQLWMAQNLDYEIEPGSCCFDKDSNKCKTNGRLYEWETACSSCPSGWHLPSDSDWMKMENELGMDSKEFGIYGIRGINEGQMLKEKGNSGFNAVYSGMCDPTCFCFYEGEDKQNAYFWTCSEIDVKNAICREIMHMTGIGRYKDLKKHRFSVRCVKN
jgi:uncharacterized protein (TIGR02145 family)